MIGGAIFGEIEITRYYSTTRRLAQHGARLGAISVTAVRFSKIVEASGFRWVAADKKVGERTEEGRKKMSNAQTIFIMGSRAAFVSA
jgi:hypothetical protein